MKNCKIGILTATYNHPNHLKGLYKTLIEQDNKNFVWVLVNDGSRKDTDDVINTFILEDKIVIRYLFQENKGKSAAVNYGLDNSTDLDFVVIIDDDEELNPNAVDIVCEYVVKYYDKPYVAINFTRAERNGKVLSNVDTKEDRVMTAQKHRSLNMYDGGYIGYYINKLGDDRFPLYKGEKYIGPSVLIMMESLKSPIVYSLSTIGATEFLDGGITVQGRSLRLKNPKGMIKHASLMMHADSSLKIKIAYSILAYAYKYYSGLSTDELNGEGLSMSSFYKVSLFGWLLSKKWKKQYGFVHY